MTFFDTIQDLQEQRSTNLCLGLDPRPIDIIRWANNTREQETLKELFSNFDTNDPLSIEKLSKHYLSLVEWLLDTCREYISCVKINLAFYQQYALENTMLDIIILARSLGLPAILDAKFGDIQSTAKAYARAAFERFSADAVTLHPYLGSSSITPFLTYATKAVFVLSHTSNPDAQYVQTFSNTDNTPLYEHIVQPYMNNPQIGFVCGATHLETLRNIRSKSNNWILTPGVGAQGGTVLDVMAAANKRVIIPISRAIVDTDSPKEAIERFHAHLKQHRANSTHDHVHPSQTPVAENRRATEQNPNTLHTIVSQLCEKGMILFGDYTYKSGIRAPFYVNLRDVIGSPSLLRIICEEMLPLVTSCTYNRICGIAYGALGFAFTLSDMIGASTILLRKEGKKEYGTQEAVVGPYAAGDRVVIIEEMTSTGSTIIETALSLRKKGLEVNDVIVFYTGIGDPEANLAQHELRLHRVLDFFRLLSILHELSYITDVQKSKLISLTHTDELGLSNTAGNEA